MMTHILSGPHFSRADLLAGRVASLRRRLFSCTCPPPPISDVVVSGV